MLVTKEIDSVPHEIRVMSVAHYWVACLTLMQQSVLFSAIRGPDGVAKRHKCKMLIRYYRRCVLLSAFDGKELFDPCEPGGGSFTGPIVDDPVLYNALPEHAKYDVRCAALQRVSDDFIDSRDELPHHYWFHFMHAVEILGYKFPDPYIREFWNEFYKRMVHVGHVWPETESQMDARLGDDPEGWAARNDVSTSCSD